MSDRKTRRNDRRKDVVVGRFGEAVITFHLRKGDVSVTEYADEIATEDRNEGTAWVLAHLRAIGMPADPLDIRDMLWKS